MDFCVSLIIFVNSKKNGGKSPAKITKSTKLRQFFMSILKGLNDFLKNIPEKKYLHFIILFPFLTFFWFMNTQKAQKLERNMRILSSSKRGLRTKCWICCKNSTNVAKKFSNNSLVSGLFPNFFSGCYINMFQRKNLRKVEKLTRNSQKTAFSWENMGDIL